MLLRTSQSSISSPSSRMTFSRFVRNSLRKSSSVSVTADCSPFDFSQEEIHRILEQINSKSGQHLANYNISKAKLNKIESWKSKNGNFRNLDDILHLDGFSVKIVEKFCKSLLGEVPVKRPSRKAASFVTPAISEDQIDEIKSSVSVSVGVSSIIWSRLVLNKEGPCDLTHWHRHDIKEKKLHMHDLIQRCFYIDHLIPQGDCYLFENPQVAQATTPGNAEQVNINVQRAQLTAILGFALANRNTQGEGAQSNVFYMKRFLAARLFQHLIGTERISAEKTILSLMRTYYNAEDDLGDDIVGGGPIASRANVTFPGELRAMYKEAEGYHREFLGQTLLLNLAFVRLVLLRDVRARAMVSRSSKVCDV